MARRVRFFSAQIDRERDPIYIRPLYDSAPLMAVGPRAAQTIDDLDVTLSEHESRMLEMNEAYEVLSGRLAELIEARHVLRETAVFFQRVLSSLQSLCWPLVHLTFYRPNPSKPRSDRLLMTARRLYFSTTIVKTSILHQPFRLTSSMILFLSSKFFGFLAFVLGSSLALSTAPVCQRLSACSGVFSVATFI